MANTLSRLSLKPGLRRLAPLRRVVVRDGLIAPWVTMPDQDERKPAGKTAWSGVYTASGASVRLSLLSRNRRQLAVPGAFSVEAEDSGSVVYAGPVFNHFGHFLLESLARLWAAEAWPDAQIAWSLAPGQGELTRWQREILRHFGLENRVCLVDRPTRFSRVIVPEPGFQISDRFHARHARFLCRTGPKGSRNEKIWLSRARLKNGPTRVGFETVEACLPDLGWKVVHPQELPLSEQLALFAAARRIGGEEGSALHLAMLVPGLKGMRMDVLPRRGGAERIRPNFHLIAKARGIDMHGHTIAGEDILWREGPEISKSMGRIEDYQMALA